MVVVVEDQRGTSVTSALRHMVEVHNPTVARVGDTSNIGLLRVDTSANEVCSTILNRLQSSRVMNTGLTFLQ
jgi:hypothetical protein